MGLSYEAETMAEVMDRIKQIKAKWGNPKRDDRVDLWFRGSQKSYWPLVPGLYRHLEPKAKVYEAEDEIREDFIKRAPSLTEHKPANGWEWYFVMQHYAAPTRLLDWTESPYLGLYFAVRDGEGLHDACVWVLDPWWLNRRVLGKAEVLPPGSPGLANADTLMYRRWLPDRFNPSQRLKTKLPVAVFPNYFDRRISAQRSCFTVHGLRREGLEELFPKVSDGLAKIIIPAYATEDIREELGDSGIDEVTIYPELQGLGTTVSRNWLSKSDVPPHGGLYTRLQPSKIHGVGVFAIKKIKKGTRLFSEDLDEMRWVNVNDLPRQKQLRQFYEDFAIWKNGRCGCPAHFHRLTMSWYLNDPPAGQKPNVECDDNYEFKASRDIKRGDELTVDSNTYSDHKEFQTSGAKGPRKKALKN
jgi:hypothetical protein